MRYLILISFIFIVGCPSAGRDPNPIAINMPGDENRTCKTIKMEMEQICESIKQLKPKENKFLTNTIWFIVWAPLMDVKDAEKIEIEAFQRRYNRLLILATEKNCTFLQKIQKNP